MTVHSNGMIGINHTLASDEVEGVQKRCFLFLMNLWMNETSKN